MNDVLVLERGDNGPVAVRARITSPRWLPPRDIIIRVGGRFRGRGRDRLRVLTVRAFFPDGSEVLVEGCQRKQRMRTGELANSYDAIT